FDSIGQGCCRAVSLGPDIVRACVLPLSTEGGDVDLIATLLNTFVVVAVGVVLTYVTNDRFKALRGEMAEFRSEIAGIGREMSDLRTDIKADIARVEA